MATSEISFDASQPTNPQSESSTSTLPVINIGTRRSPLALKQTDLVEAALKKAWPDRDYTIHAMATTGDKNQVTPLHEMGAKALWTHELEALLLEGKLDLVVHCLKGGFGISPRCASSTANSCSSCLRGSAGGKVDQEG